MTGLCDCDCHKDSATTVVCRCDCTSDAPPERMADRPGEADVILDALQLALEDCDPENDFSPGQVFVDAIAALDRLTARLSAAEHRAEGWVQHDTKAYRDAMKRTDARLAEAEARLSDYEQARDVLNEWRHGSDWMGEGSGQMPDRVAILRLEEILFPARAALSGSAGPREQGESEADAGDAAGGVRSGDEA